MKRRAEKGITLIALVITIIVLLILAAVAINTLFGDNGILKKASNAKLKHEIGREIEQIKLSVNATQAIKESISNLEYSTLEEQLYKYEDITNVEQTNDVGDATKVSKSSKKFNLANLLNPVSNAADEEKQLEFAKVTYESKRKYYVKISKGTAKPNDPVGTIYEDASNKSNSTISDKDKDKTKTLAQKIQSGNYGDKIEYTSSNGVSDWRVFYNDGENVFLISTDSIQNSLIDLDEMEADEVDNYQIRYAYNQLYGGNVGQGRSVTRDGAKSINKKIANKYMLSWLKDNQYENNYNAKLTAALMDQNVWSGFKDDNYADSAIGGSTIEMFINSLNNKTSNKLYYKYDNSGYSIGLTENTTGTSISYSEGLDCTNDLYFPEDGGKWIALASPASRTKTDDDQVGETMLEIGSNGLGEEFVYSSKYIRPVVCLNTNTLGDFDEQTNTWKLSGFLDNNKKAVDLNDEDSSSTTLGTLTQNISVANYGDKIKYTSPNGVDDWKILYNDGKNVFIVASQVVPNSTIDTDGTGFSVVSGKNYEISFDKSKSTKNKGLDDINVVTARKFKNNWMRSGLKSGEIKSSYQASYLFLGAMNNTSYWTSFVDSNKADNAIGGPTLEMLLNSWNQKENGTAIKYLLGREGYHIAFGEGNFSSNGGTFKEQSDTLYFPVNDSSDGYRYFLASPAQYNMLPYFINSNGFFTDSFSFGDSIGFRPVVCLKSNMNATYNSYTKQWEFAGEEEKIPEYAEQTELENWEYTMDNSVLKLTSYKGSSTKATVYSLIKYGDDLYTPVIDKSAFTNNTTIEEIEIQDGVTTDNTSWVNAFQGCANLKKINKIPNEVVNLSGAFNGCVALTNAPILSNNIEILDGAFSGCSSLIEAPDISDLTKVKSLASTFAGCTALTSAPKIPINVTNISGIFAGCLNIGGTIEILSSNISVASGAFGGVGSTDGNYNNADNNKPVIIKTPGKDTVTYKTLSTSLYPNMTIE